MEDKHVHFHQENIYGDKYDIHDNPNATFNFGGQRHDDNDDDDDNKILLEELKPFFFGFEEEAKHFLKMIKGMNGQDITQLVNRLLREQKISNKSCLKPLWTVLNRHGLYNNAYSTWAANIVK